MIIRLFLKVVLDPGELVRRINALFGGGIVEKLLLSFLLLGLVGCLETKHLRNLPDNPGAQDEKLTPADFVYSKVYTRVLAKKCAGCHRAGKVDGEGRPRPDLDNPGNVNLENYENTQRKLSYIKSVVETGMMGFESTPNLTDLEKQLILGWIEAGAPR